ncbi:tolloid-like protein 1 isoform X2 [Dermacentor andersoni]|uniref:tolloid-like protein 1 isoform X2 n=1 Tax=Dermacentor andersoni TaxID=34620 RepID=UPI002417B794|nr:cubilin-like isoform X2 [Dermacentor andersoni]
MSAWPPALTRGPDLALLRLLLPSLLFTSALWPAARARNASCGGFLTQFRGHFQSPNYPDHYDDSAVCRWYIFAPKEFAILIEKHAIDIEDDANRADCPYDYLRYSFGNWKKTFCGKGAVEPILLDTNFVTVVLKTDASMSGTGFNISYRFVLPPCVRTFTSGEGLLEIPEDKSKRNMLIRRRRWCFRSARGNSYQFTFDYFDLVGEPPKCRHMYMKVLEKNEGQVRSHSRMCGKLIPEPVHTRSSSVSLLFLSDRPLDKNGLHVSWKVFGCNEEHRAAAGKLRFPREGVYTAYPATCRWTIYANSDQTVELTVTRLNLQRCDLEYLRIFEGEGERRTLLDDVCRLDSPVVISSTRRIMSLQLRLHALRRDAVEAAYQMRATPCGGLYEASEGSIVSPADLAEAEGGLTCLWTIRVRSNYLPRVEFREFAFSESENCSSGYIEAYFLNQGSHMQLMPRRCAAEPPPPVVGIDNEVRVKLHVEHRDSHTHFRLRFRSGERLALFVTDVRFSKSKYCAASTLTVTDGTQPTSPVLATLSRPEPRAFLSSEDALSLRICGGVVKFVYMSVPSETCSKAEQPVTEPPRREVAAKAKAADTSVVWEEIDQTPS